MQKNNHDMNSLHVHYSPTAHYSIGVKSELWRGDERSVQLIQLNTLVKRWNTLDSQANLYLKTGVGVAENNSHTRPALRGGVATDWETRRYFVSYENQATYAHDIEESFMHRARVGIAPYVAEAGELHTWAMLEMEADPGGEDDITLTPLLRFFKGSYLWEVGYSNHKDLLFNWIVRF